MRRSFSDSDWMSVLRPSRGCYLRCCESFRRKFKQRDEFCQEGRHFSPRLTARRWARQIARLNRRQDCSAGCGSTMHTPITSRTEMTATRGPSRDEHASIVECGVIPSLRCSRCWARQTSPWRWRLQILLWLQRLPSAPQATLPRHCT